MRMNTRRIFPIKSPGQMAVVSVWRGWWRGHLSIFCIQIVVGALLDRGYQISDGGETFQMINSGTDPWWWQPPPVLTLAYCNVITIKHWPPPPPALGDQTALTWEGQVRVEISTDQNLTRSSVGGSPLIFQSLYSQIVILVNSKELQHKDWRLLRRVSRLEQAPQ